ncbi:TPA: OFA family MFS transporter, partial [Streptococcus pneumoniae]|nr:OFA family MFS transporter [Streptococcus pneumoniae]
KTGWDQASVAFAFSLAIFCLGLSAAFMGRLVEKFGPKVMGSLSAFLYAGGNILTGFAIDRQELWLLYLAYGILGGLGLGAGYITPVSTIIKWFPDKRGLATGLAIMGFGFASLLTSPIAQHLIAGVGIVETFYILGASYFIIMLLASQFIKRPNEQELAILSSSGKEKTASLTQGMAANQALKSNRFYMLWIIFFINIACGLGLISAASPMAQEMAGLSTSHAAVMVGVLGIFNGFGRLLWASLSDYIGRPLT